MYNCIVIDDEKLARERVTSYLKHETSWNVVAEGGEYDEAKKLILKHRPDACFLDIEIIGGSGIDLANELSDETNCFWVFTTAYSQHAVQAFEIDAIDYLLKPFEDNRIAEMLGKLEKRLDLRPKRSKNIIAVKSIGAVKFVNIEDIIWIKGAANYVELHCKEKMLLHRETLSKLEQQLDPSKFVRVHRSALVNLEKIRSLNSELGRYSLLQLENGDEVKISQAHRSTVFEQLGLESQ